MDEGALDQRLVAILERASEPDVFRSTDEKYKEQLPKWVAEVERLVVEARKQASDIDTDLSRAKKVLSDLNDVYNIDKTKIMKNELAEIDARMKKLRPLYKVNESLEALETYEHQRKRNYKDRANLILSLENSLRGIQRIPVDDKAENLPTTVQLEPNWKDLQLKASMMKTLRSEVIFRKERLIYDLYEAWGETFHWDMDNEPSNRLCLNITGQFNDLVAGLTAVQLLEKKMDHFGKCLLNYLLIPLLKEKSSHSVHIVSLENGKVEISITKSSLVEAEDQSISALLDQCVEIFRTLQRELSSAETFLQTLVEGHILKSLKEFIVDSVLKPAVPSENVVDPKFSSLLSACDDFLRRLNESGIIKEENSSFEQFAANLDTLFLAKRCQTILDKARKLVMTDLHNSVQVGGEPDDATKEIEVEKEKSLPPVASFQRCRVSESVVSLLELMAKTLDEASKSEKPLVAGRLYSCSRDMVELYLDLVLVRHEHQLKTVPQITAIFFNNCYFLCHHLTSLGSSYEEKLLPLFGTPSGVMTVSFMDFIPRLKQMAAEYMEVLVTVQSQYLIDCLKPARGFDNISDPTCSVVCQKALKACSLQFSHIHRVCRQVLAPPVLLKLQGKLFEHLLNHVVNSVSRLEDIASKDAEIMHQHLSDFLKEAESCFMVKDVQYIQRYCENGYYKYKELMFVLNASLTEIEDRWASGSGPLAHWMDPLDLKQLIRALFQNTDRRAALLAKIK